MSALDRGQRMQVNAKAKAKKAQALAAAKKDGKKPAVKQMSRAEINRMLRRGTIYSTDFEAVGC